jgi:phosphonate transport system ATP-binding protein
MHQMPELVLADEPLSALDPVLADDVLATLLQAPACLISLHRPELMHRFNRVLGVRHGELVLDQHPDAVTEADLKWLYSES